MLSRICPNDGSKMRRGARPLVLKCEGLSKTFKGVEGWYCSKCDEAIFDPKDMKIISRLWNELKAKASGQLAPEEIKTIRKKLKLSQERAGILIGGGPRAFQKYESGDVLQSKAVDLWLKRLDSDPSQLSFLEDAYSEQMRAVKGNASRRGKTVFLEGAQ